MNITTLGIDLAKDVFQLHGIDNEGNVVLKKKLPRTKLSEFIATLSKCLIGTEACGGANYWARKIRDCEAVGVVYLNPKHTKKKAA